MPIEPPTCAARHTFPSCRCLLEQYLSLPTGVVSKIALLPCQYKVWRNRHLQLAQDLSEDVPGSIDLRAEKHAREWAASAMSKRPWRAVLFQKFAELQSLHAKHLQVMDTDRTRPRSSLHFASDPSGRVRNARRLFGRASFGARTAREPLIRQAKRRWQLSSTSSMRSSADKRRGPVG